MCWEQYWKQAVLQRWLQPIQEGAEQLDAALELVSEPAAAALVGSPLTAASDVAVPVITTTCDQSPSVVAVRVHVMPACISRLSSHK